MEQKQHKPTLEFETHKKYQVKLLFPEAKTGKAVNKQGKEYSWYLYGVEYNNIEYSFFADYSLNNMLKGYTKGDILQIVDSYEGDNPYGAQWSVSSVGSDKPLDEIMKNSVNKTTVKVETWAAMKVASAISKDIDELKINTHSVIEMHKEICNQKINEEELFGETK
tara:strand:- start:6631 stop:7128 length:498 start_codon:yes stop_codon:yes gene_type:complete